MMNSLANHCERIVNYFVVFVLCATVVGCSKTLHGIQIPPCPPPSDQAIVAVERMIQAEQRGPHGNEMLLVWIAEVERHCRALKAYLIE